MLREKERERDCEKRIRAWGGEVRWRQGEGKRDMFEAHQGLREAS